RDAGVAGALGVEGEQVARRGSRRPSERFGRRLKTPSRQFPILPRPGASHRSNGRGRGHRGVLAAILRGAGPGFLRPSLLFLSSEGLTMIAPSWRRGGGGDSPM